MSSVPPAPSSSSVNPLLVVAIVVGVFVMGCTGLSMLLIVCITAVQLVGTSASMTFSSAGSAIALPEGASVTITAPLEAEIAGSTFVAFLALGKPELAYEQLSAERKQAVSLAEFRNQTAGQAGEVNGVRVTSTTPTRVRMQGTIDRSQGGTTTVGLELIPEGPNWRVDRFTIGPQAVPADEKP